MFIFPHYDLFKRVVAVATLVIFSQLLVACGQSADAGSAGDAAAARDGGRVQFGITTATWNQSRNRVEVSGTGGTSNSGNRGRESRNGLTVTVTNAATGALVGSASVREGKWSVRDSNPDSIPCRVRAEQSNGEVDEKDVSNAPIDCDNGNTPPPTAQCSDGIDNDGDGLIDFPADPGCADANDNDEFNAPPPPTAQCSDGIDNDGDGLIDFPADPGCVDANDNDESNAPPPTAQCSDGIDNDGDGLIDFPADPGCTDANDNDEFNAPPQVQDVSINSTSRNGFPGDPVTEQTFTTSASYNILSTNDLGMHCGDLDTRISSILPPFNVVHAQVIQRGAQPTILTPADGVSVVYSAASNPSDPILTGANSAGSGPVASSMLADGSVYKTNFWDVARDAYRAFYPSLTLPMGLLDAFYPAGDIVDLGLPMPNVERFYLGDGILSADQQEMNGINGAYVLNATMPMKIFTNDQPFFINFPFGYTQTGVDWFEAAGIPLTAFDDYGRENPWPLMRVQAVIGGNVVASIDTVLPISGEANCGGCHNDPLDVPAGTGTGIATANLATVTLAIDDPEFGQVPLNVSREWAADVNILRLHDQEHSTDLLNQTPVVCQRCHYTPALDLAQLGPLGPENDAALDLNNGTLHIDSLSNGRDQIKHRSMSNVMHKHHGSVTDNNGNLLFPSMPPSVDSQGNLRDAVAARDILNQTCYQCHPGRRTDCLRGAMANGGMLCQDCHGDMNQVGSDFTNAVSPSNPGAFDLGSDFYTNAATPRVPWANEPGCGSCHTGDVNDNLHGTPGTVGDPEDGIRLMQAYRTGDAKATPIVPTNKRFAENTVASGPAAGNPVLYRVSTGHGGVYCEGCHGATHGIWPNKNPGANDNVAAVQLQGHTGVIVECTTCHGTAMNNTNTNNGPHGMHPVGDNTSWARGGHENVDRSGCSDCHGPGSRSANVGTVLSAAKADRNLRGTLVRKGEPVGCTVCH